MKVYLDNNIVSAIAKDDEPAESDALDRLLIAWRDRKVDLVTSELTLAEIERYQDTRMRAAIERIFRLLARYHGPHRATRWRPAGHRSLNR
jgi:predicted nucleic acid-binding protein